MTYEAEMFGDEPHVKALLRKVDKSAHVPMVAKMDLLRSVLQEKGITESFTISESGVTRITIKGKIYPVYPIYIESLRQWFVRFENENGLPDFLPFNLFAPTDIQVRIDLVKRLGAVGKNLKANLQTVLISYHRRVDKSTWSLPDLISHRKSSSVF